MSYWSTAGTLVLGGVVVLYLGRQGFGRRISYPLPPGPRGLPWIGNVTGIDANRPLVTYAEWAKTYGPLVYSRLMGRDVIILNSEQVAKELLENRSKNYSDRPCLITADICGLGFNTVFLSYGDRWRLHRRLFHQTFKPEAVHRFLPTQHRKACHLLRRLLDSPEQLENHVFEYTAAVIMNSTYDYDPASREDEFVDMVSNLLNIIVPVIRPDVAVMLGAFPWLLYLPSWFPGMSFKREIAKARELSELYVERPFEYALRKAPSHTVAPSMVSDALREIPCTVRPSKYLSLPGLKEAAGSAFLVQLSLDDVLPDDGGEPRSTEKAQAQIDAVVGRDRLPTMDDRPLLPYLDAIFRETYRYSPVGPLSLPHATVDDDVYNGFHIPKGAIVLANVWAMAHDETKFPEPQSFVPERFLNEDGSLKPNEVEHLAYGFGRRICVGRHFADTSVWSVIAKVLAVFKILRPLDENGVEVLVVPVLIQTDGENEKERNVLRNGCVQVRPVRKGYVQLSQNDPEASHLGPPTFNLALLVRQSQL